ncbi:methyltransferase [Subtercola boreus]|uniref:Methyltransferase n=1 Tax=Subtercola boreus TaxID=120213 RepID=A0A3E0VHI5_9MICO|nr:transcription antitermination factor NusB [Subtercola boreus]RFA09396.1 methyltransferase [Subtercola boreus]TQL53565.1 16S rRNA (cytosine967-C5)-methyltransferase [Subtercola boreus]
MSGTNDGGSGGTGGTGGTGSGAANSGAPGERPKHGRRGANQGRSSSPGRDTPGRDTPGRDTASRDRGRGHGAGRDRSGTAPGPRERTQSATAVQPARRIAFEVIRAVREDDAYANLLLPTKLARAKLNTADAGLATELTYGTLRLRGYYDRVIELAANRPIDEIDGPLVDVLELAAHQLLSLRVASHAAVNEAVELARVVASRSSTGFVNGVLRTITRSTPEEWQDRVLGSAQGDDGRLEVLYSHPSWIIRAFRRALLTDGATADEAEVDLVALLEADNEPAKLGLVALPGLATRDEIGVDGHPAPYSPFGFITESGDPRDIPEVKAGTVRVQDEGSQLAALALSRAQPIRKGERWLDLCAGPGGKSAVLAAEAREGGAVLTANEPVPARAELVRNALAAIPDPPVVWELDGTTVGESHPGEFDRILVDAPCTGLGALRRRPEARWRKSPKDVAELVVLQSKLIDSAMAALKPGGILAYLTCSPHVAETRGQATDALKRHAGTLEPLATQATLQALADTPLVLGTDETQAQLWPHVHGTDAMFIALFRKL